MIIIGLTDQVLDDVELESLTGMARNHIIWHQGNSKPYIYEPYFKDGHVQSVDGGYWVEDNVEALDLQGYKDLRIAEIKEKTVELINNGYTYEGVNFSLSFDAQVGLIALNSSRNDPAITYPQPYGNIDDTIVYQIQNEAEINAMYLTALGTKKYWLETEDTLKSQINSASSYINVQSIIDNR